MEIRGKRGDALDKLEQPAGREVAENAHRRVDLVDRVGKTAVGKEGQMARAGAGGRCGRRRIVRQQLALGPIEPVDHDLVQTQIGHEDEIALGVGEDLVGVGTLLPLPVWAAAVMLNHRGRRARRP